MNEREKASLIFLSEKALGKKDSDILFDISNESIKGEIKEQNFIYSIGEEQKLMSFSRIWDFILSQISSKSESRYLSDLKKYLNQYSIPDIFFSQLYYINPENKELKLYEKQ